MRDSLDRSITWCSVAWRTAGILLSLVIGVPSGCVALHNATHRAPLGRSERAILRSVDTALPLGSSIDSAAAFFNARKVDFIRYRYVPSEVSRWYPGDSLATGGSVIEAVLPGVTRDLYIWDGVLTLYFSMDGRLAARQAKLSAVNPL